MESKERRPVWPLIMAVVASVALIWVLVVEYASDDGTQVSLTGLTRTVPEHQAVRSPNAQAEDLLPAGTVVLSESRADVDEDGIEEIVIAFNDRDQPFAVGAGGLLVVGTEEGHRYEAWRVQPSTEGRVAKLALEDINGDGNVEILLYKASEDGTRHYLHIHDWKTSAYVAITPRGGPLDGSQAFESAYYPPDFVDVDADGADELLVYKEEPGYQRLGVLAYIWTNGMFVYEDSYYVVGPSLPEQ